MSQMKGKKAVAEMLIAEGVRYVFGNPGSTETPLMDVMQDYPELKYVLALQEASAVGMADGYARASGKTAFANLHIAPGLANGLSMLYNSYRGGTPMVLTAGSSDTSAFLTDPFLSGDLVEMTRQYTKWSAQISHAAEIPMVMRRAFRQAKTPPTGPVFVSLPVNVLDEEADVIIAASSPGYFRLRPDADAVDQAAALLAEAKRPMIVIGDRVAQSDAVTEMVALAEVLGACVYGVSVTQVNFPTSHPQYLGIIPLNRPYGRELLSGSDVILAVGANVFTSFWYRTDPMISAETRLVHLDCAVGEIEKIYHTDIGLIADPKAGLIELTKAIHQNMGSQQRELVNMRLSIIRQEKEKNKRRYSKQLKEVWDNSPMSVERMMAELAQSLPWDAIVAEEAVTSRSALLHSMDFDLPGSLYSIQGGGLGWAMGGALGIKLACPDQPVVAVVGDGASMYTIQALWTAARYNVPVIYIICNNQNYKILKINMDIYLRDILKNPDRGSDYIAMDFPIPLDLAGISKGFGVNGRKVSTPSEFRSVIGEALTSGKPYVVDVAISSYPYPMPTDSS